MPSLEFFDRLVANRRARLEGFARERALAMGLQLHGEEAVLPDEVELLDTARIRAGLSSPARDWLVDLVIKSVTESTNSDLMACRESCIDGRVLLAEAQLGGRGRRGRVWMSPFARNIALTIGMKVPRSGVELGCLSLVTGLAVVEGLKSLGVKSLALKWPNDVLYDGRKLCGVLIEMRHSLGTPQAVVGIGVNYGGAFVLRGRVDQPLADLDECDHPPSRNALVAALISSVHDYALRFASMGFAFMRESWEAVHFYQGREVNISGSQSLTGKVLGVSHLGELRLLTSSGEQLVSGGELSMRIATTRSD